MKKSKKYERLMEEIRGAVEEACEGSEQMKGPGVLEEMERRVEEAGRKILRGVLDMMVRGWTEQNAPRAQRCGCGADQDKGMRVKSLLTGWGWVELRREYRRCSRCDHSDFAGDKALGVEEDGVSPRMRQKLTLLGTLMAFEQVPGVVKEMTGETVTAKLVQRVTEKVGAEVVKNESQGTPIHREKGRGCEGSWYVMVDANSVNTVEGWKNVRNGVIRSQEGGTVRYVADLVDYETFGERMRAYAGSVGIRQTQDVIALADGLEANWKLVRANFPGAREILDFYHGAENIWKASRGFYGEGDAQGRAWAEARCRQLKEQGPGPLLEELGRRIPRQKEGAKKEALESLASYVRTNQGRMNYPEYQKAGLVIGSGAVESACKGVTGARLKGTGMRWHPENVRRMAHLRAIYKSGLWSEMWERRRRGLAA